MQLDESTWLVRVAGEAANLYKTTAGIEILRSRILDIDVAADVWYAFIE